VYLCRPTEANAARVARDAARGLYGAVHCNWSRRAERRVLEALVGGRVERTLIDFECVLGGRRAAVSRALAPSNFGRNWVPKTAT